MAPSVVEVVEETVAGYKDTASVCATKLERLMLDTGKDAMEVQREVSRICVMAADVWHTAVEKAESNRNQLLAQVEDTWREVWHMQQQLGMLEPKTMEEHNMLVTSGMTVKAALDHATAQLAKWRALKVERQKEYDAVQASISTLRQQLGQPHVMAKPDLTKAGMDFLCLERERLLSEQERQLSVLQCELGRLQQICDVLGEDAGRAAAEAHHSLRHSRSDDNVEQSCVDLSSATVEALGGKIRSMHALKVEREAQLQAQQDVLCSLWEALRVPPGAAERAVFANAMSGPMRLHKANMDKVLSEVRRLEECRAQAMRDLTLSKARDLQAVCQASHLPCPPVEDILAGCSWRGGSLCDGAANVSGQGQISDALSRVCRGLSEVLAESARRKPLVSAITELQEACAEAHWLQAFNAEGPEKYKARDYTARVQRAGRAEKLLADLPKKITRVRQMLADWQLTQDSGVFLWDGADYMPQLEAAQQESAALIAAVQAKLAARPAANSKRPAILRPQTPQLTPAAGKRTMSRDAAAVTPAMLRKGASMQLSPAQLSQLSDGRRMSLIGTSSVQLTPADLAGLPARTPPRYPAGQITPPSHHGLRKQGSVTPASSMKRSVSANGQSMSASEGGAGRCTTPDIMIISDVDVAATAAPTHGKLISTASAASLDVEGVDNRDQQLLRAEHNLRTPARMSRIPRPTVG